jgi:hypothetical protein
MARTGAIGPGFQIIMIRIIIKANPAKETTMAPRTPSSPPAGDSSTGDWLQVALPRPVLERLFRERALVAAELRCLDPATAESARQALLSTLSGARYLR